MADSSNNFWITNDRIGVEFDVTDSGATLSNLVYKKRGATFGFQSQSQHNCPLWTLTFHNELGDSSTIDSLSGGTFEYEIDTTTTGTSVTLQWMNSPLVFRDDDHRGHIDVSIDVRLPDDEPFVYWRPSVDIRAVDVTLWEFSFPNLRDIHRVGGDREDDYLLFPEGWGTYIRNPTAKEQLSTWGSQKKYPSWEWPMQFFSLENTGLGVYVGFHDPDSRTKGMNLESDNSTDELSFQCIHYPDNMGRNQDRFDVEYEIVTGIYEGDWYDAAQIYREWAVDNAPWTARGPVTTRNDIPAWFKELCIWWTPGFAEVVPWSDESVVDFEKSASLLSRLYDRFTVPTGVHWYGWHKNAFDTDHPDHFPPRSGFEDAVEAVQREGLHVFPYITVRSWDPNSQLWANENLEAGAAKRASPRFEPRTTTKYTETFTNPQLLSPMCAATEHLQQTVKDVVRELVDHVGVHGVYLDQMAAASPPLCFDPNHNHSLGGGSYGVAGYRELFDGLTELDDKREQPVTYTTEANAEPYMDGIGGYLMWHSARSDLVPLFSTVYGEYCFTFGREFFEHDLADDPRVFASKVAQLFTFGAQLGWFTRPIGRALLTPEHEAEADYLEETTEALYEGWEYLTAGRRLREIQPAYPLASTEICWDVHYGGRWNIEVPYLLTSVWSSPSTDGIAVAMTNWGSETQSAVLPVTAEHLSYVEGEKYEINRLTTGESAIDSCVGEREVVLEVAVPSRSTDIVEIIPA